MKGPIQHNTVFIIGAGCSMPYGFPSGQKLIEGILEHPLEFPGEQFIDALNQIAVDEQARSRLSLSGFPSIDQFLEKQQSLHSWGRLRVSKIILEAERQYLEASRTLSTRVNPTPGKQRQTEIRRFDWVQQLWSQFLDCPLAEFENHKVAFITYNYDRLIEHVLWTAMSTIHSDRAASRQALTRIPVLHLHGSLGQLQMGNDDPTGSAVPFGINASASNLLRLSQNWKFVWERLQDSPELQTAVEILARAERVVVMGLGAAVEVLEPLVKEVVQKRKQLGVQLVALPKRTEVHVCNCGLLDGETAHLKNVLSDLCVGQDLRYLPGPNYPHGGQTGVAIKPVVYGTDVDACTMIRKMPRLDLPVTAKRETFFPD